MYIYAHGISLYELRILYLKHLYLRRLITSYTLPHTPPPPPRSLLLSPVLSLSLSLLPSLLIFCFFLTPSFDFFLGKEHDFSNGNTKLFVPQGEPSHLAHLFKGMDADGLLQAYFDVPNVTGP